MCVGACGPRLQWNLNQILQMQQPQQLTMYNRIESTILIGAVASAGAQPHAHSHPLAHPLVCVCVHVGAPHLQRGITKYN